MISSFCWIKMNIRIILIFCNSDLTTTAIQMWNSEAINWWNVRKMNSLSFSEWTSIWSNWTKPNFAVWLSWIKMGMSRMKHQRWTVFCHFAMSKCTQADLPIFGNEGEQKLNRLKCENNQNAFVDLTNVKFKQFKQSSKCVVLIQILLFSPLIFQKFMILPVNWVFVLLQIWSLSDQNYLKFTILLMCILIQPTKSKMRGWVLFHSLKFLFVDWRKQLFWSDTHFISELI